MFKTFNQVRRWLPSPAVVAVIGAACGGLYSRPALAINCNAIPNHVFLAGSSAVKPALFNVPAAAGSKAIVQILAEQAANPLVVVYVQGGSCVGVGDVVSNTDLTGTASYWDTGTSAAVSCDLVAGDKAVIGASDVFPTSCSGIDQAAVTGAGLGDFNPFAQVMVFVVPGVSTETTISAEAAYMAFGVGPTANTPWNDPMKHQVRNSGSGTETMIGKAIKVPAGSWWGVNAGSATNVANAVSGVTGDAQTIGIVSTTESQDPQFNTGGKSMHMLAFQAFGQSCAYYPDSSVSALDKAMVRDGHYEIWGPLHLLTKVASGQPMDAKAKQLIDIMTGQVQLPGSETQLLDLEIAQHVVPLCSMTVARDAELGPMMSVQPTCDCYFESKTGGAPSTCKTCTPATESTDCTGTGEKCNYGYCEVMP
jgi:hypothetical protein